MDSIEAVIFCWVWPLDHDTCIRIRDIVYRFIAHVRYGLVPARTRRALLWHPNCERGLDPKENASRSGRGGSSRLASERPQPFLPPLTRTHSSQEVEAGLPVTNPVARPHQCSSASPLSSII